MVWADKDYIKCNWLSYHPGSPFMTKIKEIQVIYEYELYKSPSYMNISYRNHYHVCVRNYRSFIVSVKINNAWYKNVWDGGTNPFSFLILLPTKRKSKEESLFVYCCSLFSNGEQQSVVNAMCYFKEFNRTSMLYFMFRLEIHLFI